MSIRYLDFSGAVNFWTNIKNYILSKIPTKTSELTNDSGFLTQHQSLSNYVTTNTDQDIEGNKNFKGLLTTIPNDTIWPVTASTTNDITYLGANAIHVEQKGSGKLTDLSGGAWSVAELGVGCFFFRINNGADIRYKNFAQNTVNRIPVVSGANRFINDVTPNENNTYSLGTSSLRWKECYSNAYYLGTTAFGDIVTHNASEFLTQHQSLSNYVTLDSEQTISGNKTFTGTLTGTLTGNCSGSSSSCTGNAATATTATKVVGTVANNKTGALVQGTMGTNDCFRIAIGGASNAGWAEIATGDDYNEPIYVRQYQGAFATLKRTATLLDASGNTSFPGTVTATGFSGPLTGDVTGNCSGTSANVTGTVAIANGGTGATTRLNAVKALTNEAVGTPTHFLAITTNYAKAGYTTVAQAKTVLGITGDIVTHNASEFLTSHQSLSSCVKNSVTNNQTIKSTGITRGTAPSSAQTFGIAFSDNNGKYIGNIYGQYATDKSTYIGLYAYKGTTTSNGDNAYIRVGYDASGNVYTSAPTPATADNSTQIATTAFVKAQGYLTSHQSLANYVTTNTDQSISGIKSHSKHISILGDYVGNEASTNGRSCLYLKANRDTDGKSGLYVTKFRQNKAQGNMGNSDTVFLSHDILENETRTNAGLVESYSNWANDVPGGMSIYSTIATRNLGTSAKPWTNAYITNLNLNGNVFDPTSTDGIGTTRLLAYEPSSTTDLSNPAGTQKSGSALYDVRMNLVNAVSDNGIFDSSSSGTFSVTIDKNRTQPGTWKVLHYISTGIPSVSHHSFDIAMWVRIA